MTRETGIPQTALVYGVALLLAVLLGFSLADPMRFGSLAVIGLVLGTLLLPLLLRWHHTLLVVCWNAAITPYFLPGQPDLWMLMVVMSLPLSLLTRTLDRNHPFIWVPSLAIPMVFIAIVVIATAVINGGIGFRMMGSTSHGGRRYLTILLAIAGFFALSWVPVRKDRRLMYAALYFLSAGTAIFSDLIYLLGPPFYFLYNFFPLGMAALQIQADYATGEGLRRLSGAYVAANGIMFFLLLRFGVRGILDLTKPWRLATFLAAFGLGLMGGYRSVVVIVGMVFVFQFLFEKLHRTRLLFLLLAIALGLSAVTLPFVDRLPQAAQRAISVVPGVPVDPAVRKDARISSDWRLEMWRVLLPEVPRHIWKGKGYAMNPTDFYLAQAAAARGVVKDYEPYMISGEYHSGFLTLIIPLGVWGLLGFVVLIFAGLRVLYRNYRYGDPEVKLVNTFLLAYFLTKSIYFFGVFGGFYSELSIFTGLLGLSVSLNHGVCGPVTHTLEPAPAPAEPRGPTQLEPKPA